MDPDTDQRLRAIYYDPSNPGGLGGVQRLAQEARRTGISVTTDQVEQWLRGERAYSLHKPARRHFPRNPTYVKGIDAQWQADLADMQALRAHNSGMRYILVVVDVFSKYAWAVPVKTKNAPDMLRAWAALLDQARPRRPRRMQTDHGNEFFNAPCQAFFRQHNIEHFASWSRHKAAAVERLIRTLKHRIWHHFSAQGTKRWLELLPKVLESYNKSTHRTIGMAPTDVRPEHEDRLWARMYGDGNKTVAERSTLLSPGTMVRIDAKKIPGWTKGYIPNWTQEHFVVGEPGRPGPRPTYSLEDTSGAPVRGHWYQPELQPIPRNQWIKERILKRRRSPDGSEEVLVKWLGWPAKYNTWVPADTIKTRETITDADDQHDEPAAKRVLRDPSKRRKPERLSQQHQHTLRHTTPQTT